MERLFEDLLAEAAEVSVEGWDLLAGGPGDRGKALLGLSAADERSPSVGVGCARHRHWRGGVCRRRPVPADDARYGVVAAERLRRNEAPASSGSSGRGYRRPATALVRR